MIIIILKGLPLARADTRKDKSHERIVSAAGRRLRRDGMAGASVATIMAEAGLTHGGFYAHFEDKEALIAAALVAAMAETRGQWLAGLASLTPEEAYRQIVGRYLSRSHRDGPETGCAIPALGSEIARSEEGTREAFTAVIEKTVAALEAHMPSSGSLTPHDRAIATLALCVGGMLLARIAAGTEFSDFILLACRRAALTAFSQPSGGLLSDNTPR